MTRKSCAVSCRYINWCEFFLIQSCSKRCSSTDHRTWTQTFAVCLSGFQLALLVLWANSSLTSIHRTQASVPTAALSFIVSVGVCLLSYGEHVFSVRPSFILDIYLFLSIIFDVARARTLWLIGLDHSIPILFTVSIALKSIMIILESAEKRPILTPQYKQYPLEATSGVFSRSVFWWLSSLFLQGYRNVLVLGDLFPLDRELYSESLYGRLHLAWTNRLYLKLPKHNVDTNIDVVAEKKPDGTLFNTTLGAMKWPLLAAAFPRLCLVGFSFAQPFLINRAILFASSPDTLENRNVGYGLIGAYVLVYTGIAVSFKLCHG